MVTKEPTWLMSYYLEQHTLKRQQPTSTQRAGRSKQGDFGGTGPGNEATYINTRASLFLM